MIEDITVIIQQTLERERVEKILNKRNFTKVDDNNSDYSFINKIDKIGIMQDGSITPISNDFNVKAYNLFIYELARFRYASVMGKNKIS